MRLQAACGCVMGAVVSAAAAAADASAPAATAFFGLEAAFDGLHASSGFDTTFGSVADGQGLILRFTGGSGVSRFRIDPALPDRILEATQTARLLLGWRARGGWGVATVFAGVALEARRLSPALPDPHIGTRFAPALAADAWLTPLDRVAIHVHADVTTAFRAATLRLAPGYDIGRGVFVGPEAALSAHHGTLRTRLGLHVTGLRLWGLGLRLSGGYAADRAGRSGAYGGLSLWRHY